MTKKKYCLLLVTVMIGVVSVGAIMPSQSFAKTETIHASHKSVMGDNDSKNDVRRMCFLEAKRKVLEKAGTYIESHTKVRDYQLTKDEISTYAAALLKVDVVKEEWKLVGENMAIEMTVKANVDKNNLEQQLSKIQKDTKVQKKIKDQQRKLQQLERKVVNLQKQISTADYSKALPLRKERNVVFKQIDKLQEKKIKILTRIETRTKDALKYVERGMTQKEVKSLVGSPRSKGCSGDWNYGKVWVKFRSGIVQCIVRADCFNPCTSCMPHQLINNCIVK